MKSQHFDTTETTEPEPQVVLNTLKEYDFQDGFNNGKTAGSGV
jgi:hypothetical protein